MLYTLVYWKPILHMRGLSDRRKRLWCKFVKATIVGKSEMQIGFFFIFQSSTVADIVNMCQPKTKYKNWKIGSLDMLSIQSAIECRTIKLYDEWRTTKEKHVLCETITFELPIGIDACHTFCLCIHVSAHSKEKIVCQKILGIENLLGG